MIARVQGGSYRALSANQTCWLGTTPQGSKVIDCHLYEPITPGSNHYQACKTADDKAYITTPVLVQDIRMGPHKDEHSGAIIGKLELQEVELRAIRNSSKRYAMSTELKQDVLASLIQDDSLVGERVEQLQSVDDSSVLSAAPDSQPVAWSCPHCTHSNTTARVRCCACSKSKPLITVS